MANWFQRRLEMERGGPLPVQAPQQNYPQIPQGYQQGNGVAPSPQQTQTLDVSQLEMTPENIKLLTQYWTGGEGVATERNTCPACGSQHYFSRANRMLRGPAPAPMCYSCGYNGMFDQGDTANWFDGGEVPQS